MVPARVNYSYLEQYGTSLGNLHKVCPYLTHYGLRSECFSRSTTICIHICQWFYIYLFFDFKGTFSLMHQKSNERRGDVSDLNAPVRFFLPVMRKFKFLWIRKLLATIYISFIRPILEYGDVVLDNCTQQEKRDIEKSKSKKPE